VPRKSTRETAGRSRAGDLPSPASAIPSPEAVEVVLPATGAEPGEPSEPRRHWREDVASSVAINLRRARMERHLSLDALANRCGISRSMLSQIENQRSIPSVTILYRISEGLGLPFASLVEPQTERKLIALKAEDTRTLSSHNGLYQNRTLFPFDDPLRPIEFYEVTLLPGCHEVAQAHAVGTCEYIVIQKGMMRLKVGDRMVEVRERDSVFFQADIGHEYVNPGREPTVAYMVVTRPDRA
jgi:transcriptional regulator with XRE-family HTH domain